uniref:Galectin n=1 Tax=Pyxicephalus adspersus TaxID=30357 RepID=A0AAV3ALA6_PYXAD|nr:TPA: hypothetical protein GDO54_000044 [Pyxicephalus adspersus]
MEAAGAGQWGVIVNNLNLKPGQSIEVKGFIPENCKHFSINLGKDSENLLLHFNPRFNHHADIRKIICNSAENNVWGKEQRENVFPFKEGSVTTSHMPQLGFHHLRWCMGIGFKDFLTW